MHSHTYFRAGGHFSPHLDGPWVPHEDESSVFTVIIYLNSDFVGGGTIFLSEITRSKCVYVYLYGKIYVRYGIATVVVDEKV